MKIDIYRYCLPDYTIGKMFINGTYFCDTLEPKVRDINHDGDLMDQGETKIQNETAIPCGNYKLGIEHSVHFGKPMPYLYGVKGFTGVMVHPGYLLKHTHGCILVGRNTINGQLTNSSATFKTFWEKITPYLITGQGKKFIPLSIYDRPFDQQLLKAAA